MTRHQMERKIFDSINKGLSEGEYEYIRQGEKLCNEWNNSHTDDEITVVFNHYMVEVNNLCAYFNDHDTSCFDESYILE